MSWYTDIKTWIANNIRTNHQREITGAKMNTVLNNIVDEVDRKVDKVSGKGLSTNDYNNTEKAKVANAYSKPSGGIPKTDLASAVQTSLGKADTAVQTETDPTVPSWAKAQTKPVYTASEVGAIPDTDKGANGGVATLDSGGKVPQSQLPSYVDDVLEYANLASFPATGESGKIYVALDTNKTYRWSGSAYVEISQSLALGETSSTAFPGDRGKAIEDKIPSNASSSNKLATKAEMVPAGGTTGQVLAKKSNTDNDLEWVNQSGCGGTVDQYPTEGSTNPVQSGGVYSALQQKPTIFFTPDIMNVPSTILNKVKVGDVIQYGDDAVTEVTVAVKDEQSDIIILVYNDGINVGGFQYQNGVCFDTISFALTDMANKVSGATDGNLAGLAANGDLTDSGIAASDVATTSDLADKLDAPSTAGTSGQVLTSDGQGGQSWQTPQSGVSSYNDLNDKPQINNVPLSGNKTLSQLGIQSELTFDNAPTANSNNPVKSGGVKTALDAKQDTISDLSAIRNGAALGMTAYQKPNGGIPASDLASGVIPNSVVNATSQQDGTVVLTMANGDTITIDLNHQHINYYSKVAETTQPSGGMLPDVTYKLGTLTGATIFSFAAAVSGNLNHYYFTFNSGSTAVVPTWPASITSWDGNCVDSTTGLPVIVASKTYEVSVIDGNAIIKEW